MKRSNISKHIVSFSFGLSCLTALSQIHIPKAPEKLRQLPKNFKDAYATSEYDYEEHISFWDRFKAKLIDLIVRWFDFDKGNAGSIIENIKMTFYIIVLIAVIYVIIRLILKKEIRWLFGKNKESNKEIDVEEIQHIAVEDFNALIANAAKNNDYRSAIKYYYLLVLKRMDEASTIQYDVQKTSHDYLLALEGSKYHSQFSKVAYYYTYIWYGEFIINQEEYQKASSAFVELLNQLENE